MIQRIQTVFLFLAFLFIGLLFFFPFANLLSNSIFSISLWEVKTSGASMVQQPEWLTFLGSATLTVVFGTIFLYKNRKMQMKLTLVGIFLTLGLNAYMFLLVQKYHSLLNAEIKYNAVFVLPLVSAVLLWLAYRSINKDEQLVKSLDRLR